MENYRVIYAYVVDSIIKQLAVYLNDNDAYTLANENAKIIFGDKAFAVDATNFVVSEGDRYINGVFMTLDEETNQWLPASCVLNLIDTINELTARLDELEKKLKK